MDKQYIISEEELNHLKYIEVSRWVDKIKDKQPVEQLNRDNVQKVIGKNIIYSKASITIKVEEMANEILSLIPQQTIGTEEIREI